MFDEDFTKLTEIALDDLVNSPTDRLLIIMRGLPGSGKSTLARQIATKAFSDGMIDSVAVLSTDNWFINRQTGQYEFDGSKLKVAHEHNQARASKVCQAMTQLVIIDNTNTTNREMTKYEEFGYDNAYSVSHIVMGEQFMYHEDGDVNDDYVDHCDMRNTHNVPREVIHKMANRFEF